MDNDSQENAGLIKLWYGSIIAASAALSILGFFYGALHDPATDGGRGGALAVVVSFFALFTRNNAALRAYENFSVDVPKLLDEIDEKAKELVPGWSPETEDLSSVRLRQRTQAILKMLEKSGIGQLWQNLCIASAGTIGTLSWGFGDKVASFIQCHWLGGA